MRGREELTLRREVRDWVVLTEDENEHEYEHDLGQLALTTSKGN